MKKVLLIIAAVAAVTFVACKDEKKAADAENGESIEALAEEGDLTDPTQLGNLLDKALNSDDAEGVKGAIEAATAKAKELLGEGNGEQAKALIEKIQDFLKNNSEKVVSLIGNNETVNSALEFVNGIDAADLVDKAKDALGVSEAAEAAASTAENAKEAVEAAKDKAADAVNNAKEAIDNAKETAAAVKDAAADKGNAAIEAAKESVKEAAAEKAKEAASNAVDKGVEAVGNLLKK